MSCCAVELGEAVERQNHGVLSRVIAVERVPLENGGELWRTRRYMVPEREADCSGSRRLEVSFFEERAFTISAEEIH